MYLQCAALDGSAALEQLGKIDADRFETGGVELIGETGRSGGVYDVVPSETTLSPSTYASALATSIASGNSAAVWRCAASLNAGG